MDDLISSIGKNMIEKAIEKVLHHFHFQILKETIISPDDVLKIRDAAITASVKGPCGIVVMVHTKEYPNAAVNILQHVIRLFVDSNLIDQDMIRQIHFDRISSFEETLEIFLVGLED